MGKASRRARKNAAQSGTPAVRPAPFVARPFQGLTGEGDWVAMREIVPAATATVQIDGGALADALAAVAASGDRPGGAASAGATSAEATSTEATSTEATTAGATSTEASSAVAALREAGMTVTVTTVLPMGWPGLHRADGTRYLALQSLPTRGDASRDLAQVVLALATSTPGQPVTSVPPATADTPRLQDLLADGSFDVTVHDGFDYWIADGVQLDPEGQASMREANESLIPTVKLESTPAAYWCRVGERTHLRWIVPQDEDEATAALARMHAAGAGGLGEGTRFLGAFRADGLLAPVWDLDPALDADAYEAPLAQLADRYAEALAVTTPLDAQERRARAGLISRQLTLR